MKGISYIVDEGGKKKAAVIDLDVWGELWEDFWDGIISKERMKEGPRVKWEDIKRRIHTQEVEA